MTWNLQLFSFKSCLGEPLGQNGFTETEKFFWKILVELVSLDHSPCHQVKHEKKVFVAQLSGRRRAEVDPENIHISEPVSSWMKSNLVQKIL